MNTIQFGLGGGASIALPADIVAKNLLDHLQTTAPKQVSSLPKIGKYLKDQGGIYAGYMLGDDGVEYGIIISEEQDVGKHAWGSSGSHELSQWDGLVNTLALHNGYHPAAKAATEYTKDGHEDFYLPSRRELALCLANVPHLFNSDSWYWTSTPRGSDYVWAVDFENGLVGSSDRYDIFRVRPVRRLAI